MSYTAPQATDVCLSNRQFGVNRFRDIHHHCGVDVARGLVVLFGIGSKALPSWDSKTRRNNLMGGLAVSRTAGLASAPRELAGEIVSYLPAHFLGFSGGGDGDTAQQEPEGATPTKAAVELNDVRLADFS